MGNVILKFVLFFLLIFSTSALAKLEAVHLSAEEKNFINAYQFYQEKKFSEALQILESPWAKDFWLEREVLYLQSKSYFFLKAYEKAQQMRILLEEKYPDHRWKRDLEHQQAEVAQASGRNEEALEVWQRIKEGTKNRYAESEALFQIAELQYHLGKKLEAFQTWEVFFQSAPAARWLEELKERLRKSAPHLLNQKNVTLFLESLIQQRRFFEAEAEWKHWTASMEGPLPEKWRWVRASFLYGLGRYDESLPEWKWLATYANEKELKKNSQKKYISNLVRLKKYEELFPKDFYQQLEDLFGEKKGSEYWLQISLQARQYDLIATAMEEGGWSKRVFSKSERLWWLGWAKYQLGLYTEAYEIWKPLDSVQARYWQGKALELAGKKEESKTHFLKIAREDLMGYYGWLAVSRLHEDAVAAERFVRRYWVAEKENLPRPQALADYDGTLFRIRRMISVGLNDLAHEELLFWFENRKSNLGLDYAALELTRLTEHPFIGLSLSQTYGGEILKRLPPPASVQRFYWEMQYPRGYRAIVEREAGRQGLDPFLMFALIRAESTYRPWVLSPVGAVGLMQLMPETARKLSEATGQTGFSEESLFEPETNIALGCLYFKFLQQLFPEHFSLALASYNAGEDATARWLGEDVKKGDFESFVEEIPYSETEGYVKKIYRDYWIYRWLYNS